MSFIENIRRPIFEEMQEFDRLYSEVLSSDNELLQSVQDYIVSTNGKKLRPILTILAAKLLNNVNEASLYGALSIELLHTASLVHDDVIDDTLERRGKPSINAQWTNKIAVLTGDYILSRSLYCANKTKHPDIMDVISYVGMMLPDGELLQLSTKQQSAITEKDYFAIVKRKTALLFATCMEVGALSAKTDQKSLVYLRNFGEYLGFSFQIKDDIFDYYEDANIGKPTGNDVRDGKLTLPLIYALKNTSGAERNEIVRLIDDRDFSSENINKIMQFAHDQGGVDYANRIMEEYKQKAIQELQSAPNNEAKEALIECVEFVAARNF